GGWVRLLRHGTSGRQARWAPNRLASTVRGSSRRGPTPRLPSRHTAVRSAAHQAPHQAPPRATWHSVHVEQFNLLYAPPAEAQPARTAGDWEPSAGLKRLTSTEQATLQSRAG